VTRRERRRQRYRRQIARAVAAGAVTAVLGTIGALGGMAAASDQPGRAQALRRAPVAIEPSLVAASAAVQARAEQRYSVAVLENAAAQQTAQQVSGDSIWDRIAACETQGDWSMRGPSFSGGVGFANSTWSSFGGTEFAPNAGQATREQQIIVAERVRAKVGMGAWGCAKRLGLS
jgi:resuscitation-promoting factor RpfB